MPKYKEHGCIKVVDILGKPTPVDASRPNTMERATPRFPGLNGVSAEADYPLYWTYKTCKLCGKHFDGWSLMPQYDDGEMQYGWCGCAKATSSGYGQWQSQRPGRPKLAGSAPTRHQHDPLDD